jgi:hypothetical protein
LQRGATRERLSYRALDVEQIGSVYQTVMGFTVETSGGRSLAIKAGKNNRTPVFVDREKLLCAKGKERHKFLKENADRGQLSASVGKALEAGHTVAELAAALDPIVDERGSPKKHESPAGTPILQPTDERRRTGTHYTPRSLTAPIVKYALEPTFERLGPDATPEQILDLKVCDPALGSGAFLVEACRALAARLVEAWNVHKEKKPAIPPDEDEELHARRLVSQRCLYGVDKNPLATDLARMSLWLATLARDHEFTFLDHALKSGESLVGLTRAQIASAHWDTSKPGLPLFRQLVKDRVAEAMKGRAEIQAAPDDAARAIQEARHRSLETRLRDIRLIGDAVIAAFLAEEKPKAREKLRSEIESWLIGTPEAAWDKLTALAASLKKGAHPLTPFHWEIEFPEVFAREHGGFDAIVGNPPFAGKLTIISGNRKGYLHWLQTINAGAHGNADLVAHFFLQAFSLLRENGRFGLIATNTIAQGDTRATGLERIIERGGAIERTVKRLQWPGEAAVVVSVVHIAKGLISRATLDNLSVDRISAFLVRGYIDHRPSCLAANLNLCFNGVKIYGNGFCFDDSDEEANSTAMMHSILRQRPEAGQFIQPYIGGDELNNSPTMTAHRSVINFGDIELSEAEKWPELLDVVRAKVLPFRMKTKDTPDGRVLKATWWRFFRPKRELYNALKDRNRTIVVAETSPHLCVAAIPTAQVFALTLKVFALSAYSSFACLQSRPHEVWARFFSSSMKDDLRYTPSDCFETFAFPPDFECLAELEARGQAYHDYRAELMVTHDEGLTKTYNRFHDLAETADDIQRLRQLHAAMDRAVLEAYGWHDLAARATPIFLDETNESDHTYQGRLFWSSDFRDDVLARLLAFNVERHAEEVRLGIAPGTKGRREDAEDDLDETD